MVVSPADIAVSGALLPEEKEDAGNQKSVSGARYRKSATVVIVRMELSSQGHDVKALQSDRDWSTAARLLTLTTRMETDRKRSALRILSARHRRSGKWRCWVGWECDVTKLLYFFRYMVAWIHSGSLLRLLLLFPGHISTALSFCPQTAPDHLLTILARGLRQIHSWSPVGWYYKAEGQGTRAAEKSPNLCSLSVSAMGTGWVLVARLTCFQIRVSETSDEQNRHKWRRWLNTNQSPVTLLKLRTASLHTFPLSPLQFRSFWLPLTALP